jgi:hypothetical protein
MTKIYAPRCSLNKIIKVGKTVVYPVRRRSTLSLEKAIVTVITSNEIHGVKDNGRTVVLTHPERLAVIDGI